MSHNPALKRFVDKIPKPSPPVLLLVATILAVIFANSPLRDSYQAFLETPIKVLLLSFELFSHHGRTMPLQDFVNDALMALFFFYVGLEIKQELVVGELSSPKKAMLPVIAALGGMIVPVLFFYLSAPDGLAMKGAAIPMATDIAFALAILGAFGSRVPASLRIFLMALAVVDDIGGIIIIALFYTSHVDWLFLGLSLIPLAIIYLAGRAGVARPIFYLLGFGAVWLLFLQSGIHATISGVITALCIPLSCRTSLKDLPSTLLDKVGHIPSGEERSAGGNTVLSHDQMHALEQIKLTANRCISPVQQLEHMLSPVVSYFILPLFAFVNAGVDFSTMSMDGLFGLPLAITLGLFPGKAVGITLFTWASIKAGLCSIPEGMTLHRLVGLSIFGGIGFTVSLFIASLSYDAGSPDMLLLLNQAKLGIFSGTILSALVGYVVFDKALKSGEREAA